MLYGVNLMWTSFLPLIKVCGILNTFMLLLMNFLLGHPLSLTFTTIKVCQEILSANKSNVLQMRSNTMSIKNHCPTKPHVVALSHQLSQSNRNKKCLCDYVKCNLRFKDIRVTQMPQINWLFLVPPIHPPI